MEKERKNYTRREFLRYSRRVGAGAVAYEVAEGLTPYQAIQWANHLGQQKDFDLLNEYILETAIENKEDTALNFIQSDKERWSVFWKTKMSETAEVV